jgi:hypothetical protein
MDHHQVVQLGIAYQGMQQNLAWHDFYSRMEVLRQKTQDAIIRGKMDYMGGDATPILREVHWLLENLMAVPGQVEQRRKLAEEYLGVVDKG